MAKKLQLEYEKTEKEILEAKLKEFNLIYKDLFDNATDCIYVYDLEGNFKEINDTAVKLIGSTKEEMIGSNISRWVTPESFKLTQENLKKRIAGEPAEPLVVEIICKNGEHRMIEIKRRLIKDGDRVIAVHGVGRDITEKIKLENQLKEYHEKLEQSYEKLMESEKMYRDLFENANDGIFTFDVKGHIIAANNSAAAIPGYSTREEVIGTRFSDWLTPEGLKQALNNTRKYFSGENVKQPLVYEFIRKNGEHGWLEVRSRIIKEGDKITGVQCIARDITEKRKLEQELKESEEKYRELFENGQDVMYVLNMEGNFLNINRLGLQILGCEKEEVIGSNISKWLTPESLKIARERRRKHLSGDIMNKTDIIEFVCKNGEHRWAEIKSRAIRGCSNPVEIHGIARDITENKRLKQELKESNKQVQLLLYLMTGTRGGNTRASIVNHLTARPYNANQLSEVLNLDYKTVRHHLNVLIKNGIITKGSGYPAVYYLSKNMEENLNEFNRKQQSCSQEHHPPPTRQYTHNP